MSDPSLFSINARDVYGYCPACGNSTLRLGEDGCLTCTRVDCPRPDLVNELIGDIADARTHRAYTFCDQLVGHVTMRAFAKKSTEKITAVAYANEQKQRAEQAEQQRDRLAATILRIQSLTEQHPVAVPTNLVDAALDQQEQP